MLAYASKHKFTFDAVQMPLNVMARISRVLKESLTRCFCRNDIGVRGNEARMGDSVDSGKQTATPVECCTMD